MGTFLKRIENLDNIKIGDLIFSTSFVVNGEDISECAKICKNGRRFFEPIIWENPRMILWTQKDGTEICHAQIRVFWEWEFFLFDCKDLILYSYFPYKSPRYFDLIEKYETN